MFKIKQIFCNHDFVLKHANFADIDSGPMYFKKCTKCNKITKLTNEDVVEFKGER